MWITLGMEEGGNIMFIQEWKVLDYQISRKKFEPEPGFEPQTSPFLNMNMNSASVKLQSSRTCTLGRGSNRYSQLDWLSLGFLLRPHRLCLLSIWNVTPSWISLVAQMFTNLTALFHNPISPFITTFVAAAASFNLVSFYPDKSQSAG